jgi:hypothetical protein
MWRILEAVSDGHRLQAMWHGIVMHCIVRLAGLAGVEEEGSGFVGLCGEPFLPLPLPYFPRYFCASTTADISIHTTNAEASAVPEKTCGKTAASAVKTCVAVKSVVGMHVTSSFSMCGRSPFTEHRQHHRAHATSCASTLLPRTKRVNNE